ncbi:type II secretion system protein [Candidatus Dependentiae bacterium]|nr:type II secretion system protein [Candidatus Dependentiae bacterium]
MLAYHMQNNQSGISFIEILVVLLLISIATSLFIPRFLSNKPRSAQKKFFTEFTTLIADTVFQAVKNKTVYQVYFDLNKHYIVVKRYNSKIATDNKHLKFEPMPIDIFLNKINVPTAFTIQNFFVQGKDEFTPGMKMNEAWFYIMTDGNSQALILNINDDSDNQETKFSITINPFYSQVKLHDTFQKP